MNREIVDLILSGKLSKHTRNYIKNTGHLIPTGFNIHHIDGNHKNNDFTNLVAVPIPLHQRYHIIEQRLKRHNPDVKNELSHELSQLKIQIEAFITYRNELFKIAKSNINYKNILNRYNIVTLSKNTKLAENQANETNTI